MKLGKTACSLFRSLGMQSTLYVCDGLARNYFGQFLFLEGMVVLKGLIVSLGVGGYGDLERTDFLQFPIMKVWWSWKY